MMKMTLKKEKKEIQVPSGLMSTETTPRGWPTHLNSRLHDNNEDEDEDEDGAPSEDEEEERDQILTVESSEPVTILFDVHFTLEIPSSCAILLPLNDYCH
jgi:hypothetical protein